MDVQNVSKVICANYAEHEKNIKELCVKTSIVPLETYEEGLHREELRINLAIRPTKERPSVESFQEIFKSFDEYPSNIQKPKTSSLRVANTLTADGEIGRNDASGIPERRSASSICREFKKFQLKLDTLKAELKRADLAYAEKLQELKTFSQQVEKLASTNQTEAFGIAEQTALQTLATNLEDLSTMHANRDAYQPAEGVAAMTRFKSIVYVLEYTLKSLRNSLTS